VLKLGFIDLSNGVAQATVATAGFESFNALKADLQARGVRISSPNATVAQDIEPEYITITADGKTAYVTLQENNAIAVIDIATARVTAIQPLGLKDFSSGLPCITSYDFTNLPPLGTTATVNPSNPSQTAPAQEILLGGFSGLFFEGRTASGNLKFITHTDRGPNAEPTDLIPSIPGNERPFPLPNFQPRLVRFELNQTTGKITITGQIGLSRSNGTPLTGLPNLQGAPSGLAYSDEVPVDLFGNRLPNDPLGGDFEGVVVAPDGTFWLTDEYRPAIYHFDATGKLIDRFIPEGTPTAGGEFGTPVLPAVYAQRRVNRGFEAVALEGTKLYAFIQSALDNPDSANDATSRNSRNLRILEFDVVSKTVTGEYLYVLDDIGGSGNARTDKIGDAVSLGNGRFLVVERDDRSGTDANKLIYEINLRGATRVSTTTAAINLALAEVQEVPPVVDTAATGSFSAVLNGNVLEVRGTFSNLTSALRPVGPAVDVEGNPQSAAHLHLGAAGSNGPIVRALTIRDGGNGSGTFQGRFTLTASELASARGGLFYVNLHTQTNPAGELRGQVTLNKTLEQLTVAELDSVGINPVDKRLVTNAAAIGYTGVEKLEGLTLIDNNTIAILNDNDFGVGGASVTGDGRLSAPTVPAAIKLGIVQFDQLNGLDSSDRDGGINIRNQPVFGLYQPDAIARYTYNGQTYLVTANEGDTREYTGFTDEIRAGSSDYVLDPVVFPNAAALKNSAVLGRLRVSVTDGDLDGDGDIDRITTFGTRSFSIRDTSGNLVYDSGNQFERLTAAAVPTLFNSNGIADTSDTRSDDKGPEPEGVVLGKIGDRTFAFVGLERVGGVMVYDVTNPFRPLFIEYNNTSPDDIAPEGLTFIPADSSPNGKPLLVVTNEVSRTTSIFEFNPPRIVEGDNQQIFLGEGDRLFALGNNVTVFGRSGDERINIGSGTVFAGEGNHAIAAAGAATVYAGAGNDSISINSGNNTVYAGEGQNTVITGAGDDLIFGGAGNDIIRAGNGKNTIYAGEGNNNISTGSGDDLLYAGAGNDVIQAGSGRNTIYAGEGNNTITSTGVDLIYIGSGINQLNLSAGSGEATIIGFNSNDRISLGGGLRFADLSIKGSGSDTLLSVTRTGDLLATLRWVQPGSVTAATFV
jgi:YVTN family beta-propeller protein